MSRGLSKNQKIVVEHMRKERYTSSRRKITYLEIGRLLGRVLRPKPEYARLTGGREFVDYVDRVSIYRMMRSLARRGVVNTVNRVGSNRDRGWYLK